MIARHKNASLAWGGPGLGLQVIGGAIVSDTIVGLYLALLGTALLCIGLSYYAKAKGHHPLWCVVAIFSWVGMLLVAVLPDRTKAGPGS
jgi:hypothetical protein